jgi:hypothetical protein
VTYQLLGPLPEVSVQADPERLMQVLTNLLSNAAKFSPEGAAVTVSARQHGSRIRVSVAGPRSRHTGGIPQPHFQKFAQATLPTGGKRAVPVWIVDMQSHSRESGRPHRL